MGRQQTVRVLGTCFMEYLTAGLKIYIYVMAFIFGAVFGSFSNAWAYRIVHHENIAKGRSHCAECGHELSARDLIPVASYLSLGGKCRYCGKKISPRYLIVELLCGTYFVSIVAVAGLSVTAVRLLILGCILLISSLVDLDIMEIPEGMMIAGAVISLLRFLEGVSVGSFFLGLVPAAALLLLVLLMDKIMKRETMGGGDIKLMAVLGLHFGAGEAVLIMVIACIIGIIAAYATGKGKGKAFPFGPSLAAAAWITALCGAPLMNWYLSFL